MNICERLFLNIIEKETRTQVLSCEFCKLFKNTCFLEHLQTACSETSVRGSFFKKVACKPDGVKTFNSVRKRLAQVFLCEFWEIFRKAVLQNTS